MRRVLAVLSSVTLAATVALAPAEATAATPRVASGGGQGTADGTTPFSQFGFDVVQHPDGRVTGSFNCLMAGVSEFPGFDLMAVRGQVTSAEFSGDQVSFTGTGMFQTGNQGRSPATYQVVVTEGGPGEGTLKLTLLTPFEFVLPTEHVLKGQISVR